MPEQNGTQTNGRTSGPQATSANGSRAAAEVGEGNEKTALEAAIAQAEAVKSGFREAIAGLTRLTDFLRQAQREQKAAEKEIAGVRQTLRSLQSVRI